MEPDPSPELEAEHMLRMHSGTNAYADCLATIRNQFLVIQTRCQLLLTLATITLTITGFSGPRIASSGLFSRCAMAAGLVLVLSAVVILLYTLRIRWLTQFIGEERAALAAIIAYRNRKGRLYLLHLTLLILGMTCYVAAVIAYMVVGDLRDRGGMV